MTESPTRGDVWIVRLPRAVGAEVQRDRPVVVVSAPVFDDQPVRIIVPLMSWRPEFEARLNKVRIEASSTNGLDVASAADFLQLRSVSTERFVEKLGMLDTDVTEEIVAGVVIALDYQP
jgi:mRNA interferase MazF